MESFFYRYSNKIINKILLLVLFNELYWNGFYLIRIFILIGISKMIVKLTITKREFNSINKRQNIYILQN